MSRTIAGQIQNFQFPVVENVGPIEGTFLSDWAAQLNVSLSDVSAENLGGNEHIGATFGALAPFPDLADALSVPQGFSVLFRFSTDAIFDLASELWTVLGAANFRASISTDASGNSTIAPDPAGLYELISAEITSDGAVWTTVATGKYHVPPFSFPVISHDLHPPSVGFKLTLRESINVAPTVPTSTSLTLEQFPSTLATDTSALDSYLLSVEGVVGLSQFVTGLLGTAVTVMVRDGVDAQLGQIPTALGQFLSFLQPTYDQIPQDLPIGGTTEDIIFHYDKVQMPTGVLASFTTQGQVNAAPGGSIDVMAINPPVVTRRIGIVLIAGAAQVVLIATKIPGQEISYQPKISSYFAEISTTFSQPKFAWTFAGPSAAATATVAVSGASSQLVNLTFNTGKNFTPSGTYTLKVTVMDASGIKDLQNQPPNAEIHIVVTHETLALPKQPTGVGRPKQLRPVGR